MTFQSRHASNPTSWQHFVSFWSRRGSRSYGIICHSTLALASRGWLVEDAAILASTSPAQAKQDKKQQPSKKRGSDYRAYYYASDGTS
jgi:hypothetical protein